MPLHRDFLIFIAAQYSFANRTSLSRSLIFGHLNNHLQLLTILQVIHYTYVILYVCNCICWTSSLNVKLLVQKVYAFIVLLVIAKLPSVGIVPIYTSTSYVWEYPFSYTACLLSITVTKFIGEKTISYYFSLPFLYVERSLVFGIFFQSHSYFLFCELIAPILWRNFYQLTGLNINF